MTRPSAPTGRVAYNATAPYLDGVYLAANAIPDAYLIHDAHDCGHHKAEKIAANHDLHSDLLRWDRINRVVRTDLDTKEYVTGTDDKLTKRVLQIAWRYRPSLLVLARSNVVAAIGGVNPAVVADLRAKVGVPIAEVPVKRLAQDHVAGFFDTVEAVVSTLPLDRPGDGATWISGNLYDRHEGDQRGNVAELRRLLGALGAKAGPVLLDGSPYAELAAAPAPELVLSIAGTGKAGSSLASRAGCSHAEVPLPVGMAGTAAWVRGAGRALAAERRAEELVDREMSKLAPQLQWLVARFFMGRRVLVFADRLLLAPLVALCEELGCSISGAGCLSSLERGAFSARQLGLDAVRHPLLPMDFDGLRERLEREARQPDRALVIGNALVLQLCADLGLPAVELGYPSNTWHALTMRPLVGFEGVRTLAERMVNAIMRDQATGGRR